MFVGLQRMMGQVDRPSAPSMSYRSGAAFASRIQQSHFAQSCSEVMRDTGEATICDWPAA